MINSIRIKNFKGFSDINLQDMTRVNLISGRNNSGKSTILEAVFLFLDHAAAESFMKISQLRGNSVNAVQSELWTPLFKDLDATMVIEIEVKLDGTDYSLQYRRDSNYVPPANIAPADVLSQFINEPKHTYSLGYELKSGDYEENGHFMISQTGMIRDIRTNTDNNHIRTLQNAGIINSIIVSDSRLPIDWMGKLELQGRKNEVIEALKIIEPDLSDIVTVSVNGQAQLYTRIGRNLLPLRQSGDGINKLLHIMLAIIENPDSIILIDEIETGFHYSLYPKLWKIISLLACDYNCQIIASTHSYECIAGVTEGIKDKDKAEKFSFYRIERSNERESAYRYSFDELSFAVASNMEVR